MEGGGVELPGSRPLDDAIIAGGQSCGNEDERGALVVQLEARYTIEA